MKLMTQHDIEKGFWYYKPEIKFPPYGINLFEDYHEDENLNLFLTNKSEVKLWSKYLPTLDKVKFLWISSNVNQEIFESVCQMKNLVGLNIETTTVKNVDKIANINKLSFLRLANFTKIESVKTLGSLNNLKVLELENFEKISDFEVIGKLKNLQGLSICGSMYKAQKIENIKFVSSLNNLKYLMLINSKMTDKNLDAILNLKNLETFNSSNNYPTIEFEKLKALTHLKNSNIECLSK